MRDGKRLIATLNENSVTPCSLRSKVTALLTLISYSPPMSANVLNVGLAAGLVPVPDCTFGLSLLNGEFFAAW